MVKSSAETTAEIATRKRVSVRQVHRLTRAGILQPVTKLPGATGAYLFDPKQVDAAFDELNAEKADTERASA